MEKINWYPGHMKKTRELIQENIRMVDLVIELIDARIPLASRNPVIGELISGKPEILLLNKSDLADENETKAWQEFFLKDSGTSVVEALVTNCEKGEGVNRLLKAMEKFRDGRAKTRKWDRPLRTMIAGIPNIGKSSLINRLTGRKSAKTGDKPGVTRGKQWITLKNGMQLLDTPGILMPNIEDPEAGKMLAFCGAIKDDIYDISELGLEFIRFMEKDHMDALMERYKFDEDDIAERIEESMGQEDHALIVMEEIAVKRGFLLPGKRIDYERTARTILDEFRSGKTGRITLEKV